MNKTIRNLLIGAFIAAIILINILIAATSKSEELEKDPWVNHFVEYTTAHGSVSVSHCVDGGMTVEEKCRLTWDTAMSFISKTDNGGAGSIHHLDGPISFYWTSTYKNIIMITEMGVVSYLVTVLDDQGVPIYLVSPDEDGNIKTAYKIIR